MDDLNISGEPSINSIVELLKDINSTNSKVYHHGMLLDYKFALQEPATEKIITDLETKVGSLLPSDYKQFLMVSNGMILHPEARICSVHEILEFHTAFDYPKNMIVVATCLGSFLHIAINLNAKKEKCIYVIEPIGDEFFYSINCSFTEFLNRFIVSYGSDYWNWGCNSNRTINKIDWDSISREPITETFQVSVITVNDQND